MPDRILLVQLADIGDLIVTIPAIIALREALPDAHLTLLTSHHAKAVIAADLVDAILAFDKKGLNGTKALLNPANIQRIFALREGHYDTVVFFHHFTLKLGALKFWLIAKATGAEYILGLDNGNAPFLTHTITDEGFGAKHQAQYWLDLVALLGASSQPRPAHIPLDGGVLPISVKRGIRIVIHAGGGDYALARRWSARGFAQVADKLHDEYDAQIILVGTASDNAAEVVANMSHQPMNLSGKTTLTQLADILRSADLFIGTDSGVTHLAAAVRAPVLAIFGATNHEAWSPWSPNGQVTVLRSAPECSPCIYVKHSIGAREGCEQKTCMTMITPNQVLTAARQMLSDDSVPVLEGYPFDARDKRDWKDRVHILGLPVDNITYRQWLNLIDKWVKEGTRPHHVCTTNPEFMMMAQHDPNFKHILQRADLCVPDGSGLLWAAKLLKSPLKERVTGSDGVPRIAKEAALRGWKLFLLGAAEGIAEQTAEILTAQYAGLQIVGTYAGSPSAEEEADIVAMVNDSGADIVLVAYGAPKQDKWIARNMPRLTVKMAMGVGGTFDFIVGKVPRAPQWMQDYHLEWLYRLYKEPWRIWRMMRLPRFVLAVILRGAH
ncbi:MAG: WecB/TagA/CpsF family glycosyltransferase [Phototrophicaceae bacterium]